MRERRGDPDIALSVWVAEQQEVAEDAPASHHLVFLRHPDIPTDVWATPPPRVHGDTFCCGCPVRIGKIF